MGSTLGLDSDQMKRNIDGNFFHHWYEKDRNWCINRYRCLVATGPHNHKLHACETTHKEILLEDADSLTTASDARRIIKTMIMLAIDGISNGTWRVCSLRLWPRDGKKTVLLEDEY